MSDFDLTKCRRWVIKIGSSLVTADGRGLDHNAIADWAQQIVTLRASGIEIILVSSGAVAEGMARLGWKKRPHALHELQACAAVGQMGLLQAYELQFSAQGLHSAQVLLTHEDLRDRSRYLNARSTLHTLIRLKTIPVVNENDTVATEEIQFGDNDTLAALVSNLIGADLLVILTDTEGVYDSNPRSNPDAKLITCCRVTDRTLDTVAGPSHHSMGRGGMITKIAAARRAARSGTATIIASGRTPGILQSIATNAVAATLILPDREPLAARKQWIANQLQVRGSVTVDAGAARVLSGGGASLLAAGVTHISGSFERGELVSCIDEQGTEIARGLSNYSAAEAGKIAGLSSGQFESVLGYIAEPELIHRDNLALL